jgi:hypothetical protein
MSSPVGRFVVLALRHVSSEWHEESTVPSSCAKARRSGYLRVRQRQSEQHNCFGGWFHMTPSISNKAKRLTEA